ncbi:MAG: RHS repeat-associated core domain-containing protein [Alphaproteobacteria bacterium]
MARRSRVRPLARLLFLLASGVTAFLATPMPACAQSPTLVPQQTIAAPPSIAELARALKYDAYLIYEYVYTNIEYSPYFGVKKGALGTLLDGNGNDFDQAALLVALLRQSGYTANFVYGNIRLNQSQTNAWLGTDSTNACLGRDMLGAGGIPRVLTTSDGSCTGTFTHIDISHVWVTATGGSLGGTTYVLDPSYKAYTTSVAGIDLETAMDYSRATFVSNATSGATITSDSVQNLNRANIHGDLTAHASSLVEYIRSNMPAATTQDVIGGRYIQPLTQPYSFPTSLSYQKPGDSPETWTGDIPDTYRTTLRVQVGGVDQTWFTDEIYGHRLTVVYDSSARPVLYLDGVSQGTGSVGATTISYTATFPYCWYIGSGSVAGCASGYTNVFPRSSTVQAVNGYTYFIVNGWGDTGRGMVEFHRKQLQQNIAAGGSSGSEPVLGQTLAMIGYSWLAQVATQERIVGRFTDTSSFYHCWLGIVGQVNGTFIDMPGGFQGSAVLTYDPSGDRTKSAFVAGAGQNSALEWGTIDQSLSRSSVSAISTVKLLDIANNQSPGTNLKFYDATSANWSSIQSLLSNYQTADINRIASRISNGYRVILPEKGNVTEDAWTGAGYISLRFDTIWTIGHSISSNLKGGYATKQTNPSQVVPDVLLVTPIELTIDYSSLPKSPEPVDLLGGAYLYDHDDISVGSGGFPYGLAFGRHYTSAARYQDGPLGLGWTHDFAMSAGINSDGFRGLGKDSPIDAAAAIAAIYIARDLLSDTSFPLDRMMIATLVQRWFMDRLINNTVNVNLARETRQFLRLADGSYNPPLASSDRLSLDNGQYTMTRKDGSTLAFDGNGNIARQTFPAGVTVSYGYDTSTPPRLASVSNNLGRSLALCYDGNGKLASVAVGSCGSPQRSVSYDYDDDDNLKSFTNAAGETTTFAYTTSGGAATPGLLTQIFYPAAPSTAFVTNTYDTLGRVARQANATGAAWDYFFAGYRSEEVDALGVRHVLYFNPRGRTQFEIRDYGGLDRTTATLYDGLDRTESVTAPEGNSVEYAYDEALNPWASNVASITANPKPGSPLSPIVQSFTYDPRWNRVATATDPRGTVTRNTYDPATGNLLVTVADYGSGRLNATSRFTYTAQGLVRSATDPNGTVTRNTYDTFGNLVSQVADYGTGRLNLESLFAYDAFSNVTARTDPRGNTSTLGWDAERRLLRETAPPPFDKGATRIETAYDYDADGRVVEVRRANGASAQVTATSYTATGKVATVTDPNGNVTRNAYDANDRLATVTNALGQVTRFAYDPLGRLSATYNDAVQAQPLAASTYTENGLAATFTDAAGHVTEYEYNGLDRLAELTLAAGTGLASSETYAYDAAGNRTSRVTRAGDTIAYAYDALNRLTTKTRPSPAPVVTYAYDLAGRMIGASDTSAAIEPADSPLGATNAEYGTTWTYDAINRPLETVWDPAPVPAAPSAASVTFGHSYDALNRRMEQTVTDTDWWYLPPSSTSTTAYEANELDQYTEIGAATPDYDDNGNLTDDGTFTYTYDAENRLTEIADGGGTVAEYAYDARGRRKSMTVGSDIVIYVTDAEDRVVLEYDGTTGDLQRWTVHGPGLDDTLAVTDLDAGTRETLVPDIQGSTVATLASATGALTKLGYLPFGENPTLTAGGTRYTGRLLDAETAGSAAQPSGLYYYRARMYSPTLGRFLQPDPIGLAGGPNLYAYVGNDPVNLVDPSGTWIETAWDVMNIALGAASLADNVRTGNWTMAAIDVAGLTYDVVATAVPFLPAGASTGLAALRAGNTVATSVSIASDAVTVANVAHRVTSAAPTLAQAGAQGTRYHSEVGRLLDAGGGLSARAHNAFSGANRAAGGPDIPWPGSGVWMDLTTSGQWARHERRYNVEFGKGIPLFYTRGGGLSGGRWRSGAGFGLTVLDPFGGSISGDGTSAGGEGK